MKQKTQRKVTVKANDTLHKLATGKNESKHTPGPWYLSPQNHYVRANGVHGWNIANIEDQEPYTEANAHLIAAAPDMLEALKLTYELMNAGQPLGNDDLDKVYAAIAKATNSK